MSPAPKNPKDREARKQQALERLGSEHPRCKLCGESDWRVLMEEHHIAAKRNGDETVIVCRNCHAKLSDGQRDHAAPPGGTPMQREQLANFLDGLVDLLYELAVFVKQWSERVRHKPADEAP